jgi:hypothetical protein
MEMETASENTLISIFYRKICLEKAKSGLKLPEPKWVETKEKWCQISPDFRRWDVQKRNEGRRTGYLIAEIAWIAENEDGNFDRKWRKMTHMGPENV